MRGEPQHDHTSPAIKTKTPVALIDSSYSQRSASFANTNVVVHKLTSNLHHPQPACWISFYDIGIIATITFAKSEIKIAEENLRVALNILPLLFRSA